MVMQGLPELTLLYEKLKRGTANKIARPALRKAGQIAVKKLKTRVKSSQKAIRKYLGYKMLKSKQTGGIATIKIGGGVGKKKEPKPRQRTSRKGVGIGGRNLHWFFLGTDERYDGIRKIRRKGVVVREELTGNTIRYTGRMPKQMPAVDDVVNQSKSEILAEMRKVIQKRLEAEVAKGPRKKQ